MSNSKQYLVEEKELKLNSLKTEGIVYNLDTEVSDDTVVEVGTDVVETKVEKTDKDSFEEFKELYKGVIDMKCVQAFGTAEDKTLWEDTAKEMFIKSKQYVPEIETKVSGELSLKTESINNFKNIPNHSDVLEVDDIAEFINTENREQWDYCVEDLSEAVANNEYLVYNKADNRIYEVTESEYENIQSRGLSSKR